MTRQALNHSFSRLAFTGPKGGTGKTTLAALTAEYLNYQKKKVNLVDLDPTRAFTTWIQNCQEERRAVSSGLPTDYQILDAPGVKGGELTGADYLIVPFVPHYIDLQVLINWYNSLTSEQQEKVFFLPNRYQKTKEQKAALVEIKSLHDKTRHNINILTPFPHRPALFAPLLNGSGKNFFQTREGGVYLDYFADLFRRLETPARPSIPYHA